MTRARFLETLPNVNRETIAVNHFTTKISSVPSIVLRLLLMCTEKCYDEYINQIYFSDALLLYVFSSSLFSSSML